jgi:multiple sugar transport system ATP-binding protein
MKQGVIQQVGTPTEIYDHPTNTFVAGFIGSPAMNLMEGDLSNGVFSAENVRIEGLNCKDGSAVLGFRAEDASMADDAGQITAPVYTMELLGDATMISVRVGGALVSVKADKSYRAEIGESVSISVPANICHLFESGSGAHMGV